MLAPKQIDLGGDAAWIGGKASIDAASPKDVVYCFALRRLQTIAKITAQPDP